MMGGQTAHEFIYLSPIGEDTLVYCDNCGFSANQQIATAHKKLNPSSVPLKVKLVSTPGIKTISDLASYLGVEASMTAKAVFFIATIQQGNIKSEKFVFAVVRGDMEVNETKVANTIKATDLRPATEDEILKVGAIPGFASPVGLKNILTIVDDIIPLSANLVAGANREDYHLLNVNYGRDFQADYIADITKVGKGDACIECGSPVEITRGVEVGNIFKLGTWFSEAMGCNYLTAEGQLRPVVMGSYGIGVGRLLACVAEEHHDEHGLIWPITVAPYQIHLISLPGKSSDPLLDINNRAIQLYNTFQASGIEVLFDDREESPGVKFTDADLIGIPIRITVSERALENGGYEVKLRDQADRLIIPDDKILTFITEKISMLNEKYN
jgi:prolyl-tRNA synthetase